jgi:hypothetical protein
LGPVAHINFALQLLAGAAALNPAIHRLIRRCPSDFIYGSLAADAVIGKNFASALTHCHGWGVARKLLLESRRAGEKTEAFTLGYLSHLGADVVAHNHFVPDRIVAHYRAFGHGHLYWEARFDSKLLSMSPEARDTFLRLSKTRFPEYDGFLAEQLVPTLFSHPVSTGIFRRSLKLQGNRPWQETLSHVDARSRFPISTGEVARWRTVSVALAARAVNDPSGKELCRYDPTGRLALSRAAESRRMLRHRHRRF